jgi:hypothetical protein
MSEAVVLLGCGDVGPIHEPIGQYSEFVRSTLAGADIRFAPPCCTDRGCGRTEPDPCSRLYDADVFRASQL